MSQRHGASSAFITKPIMQKVLLDLPGSWRTSFERPCLDPTLLSCLTWAVGCELDRTALRLRLATGLTGSCPVCFRLRGGALRASEAPTSAALQRVQLRGWKAGRPPPPPREMRDAILQTRLPAAARLACRSLCTHRQLFTEHPHLLPAGIYGGGACNWLNDNFSAGLQARAY